MKRLTGGVEESSKVSLPLLPTLLLGFFYFMTTQKQDKDFIQLMTDQVDEIKMQSTTLDFAIEWIGKNLDPEDVFSTKDLDRWAESEGYIKE